MDADDQHSIDLVHMWMSGQTGPHWIQYEFDKVYKLDELLVWNSNQMIEGFIGFGGATDIRFRQMVEPGKRLYLLSKKIWERHGRISSKVQGMVDGAMVFEADVVGTQM